MDQEVTISEIIQYPLKPNGDIVMQRPGLARMKPRLNAPPSTQPGSVDWTMMTLFGTKRDAIAMIESLVAGQGDNADEKWVRFILLYRQWEIDFSKGKLDEPPTFNQVCHSLDFDATIFIRELQQGVQSFMKSMGHMKMALASPLILENLKTKATSDEADVKVMELALKVGGIIESGPGMAVQINNNNTQQTAVLLKGEREKLKSPLLQFSDVVIEIDEEVRREDVE